MVDKKTIKDSLAPDLNFDSLGLMRVLSMFSDRKNSVNEPTENSVFVRLTDLEIENQFRTSTLIQKIIKKYPMESKSIGYTLIDGTGKVIEESNEILLEAFKEASIYSRLYSRCFLYLDLDDTDNDERPIRKGANITGYKIYFDLYLEGDFYSTVRESRIHRDRIIEFIGVRSYSKYAEHNDVNFADSVLQGLFASLQDYLENNANAKFILKNLSYLTVGIDNLGNMSKSEEGRKMIFERLVTLNTNRSINRTVAYDKKSELVGFITQTLSGVREIIGEIRDIFISETDYPAEEIFEQSPTQKLGSGVQNQLISRYLWARRCRNWTINNWMPYYIVYFNRVREMKGISINVPFIVDLTEEERANIENIGADRIKKLVEAGVIDRDEARTGYTASKYTLNIQLKNQPQIDESVNVIDEEPNTPASGTQDDAENIPNDLFWDALATITELDLENIAKEVLSV